ncbi:MAG: Rv3235 family protein [Actinomycetota bacterium]|nr:Rv3235 family protein [Actinomycetota bacterium]
MDTNPIYDELPSFNRITLTTISSDENEDWLHPVLEIFRPQPAPELMKKSRLYLLPSLFNDEFDPDFAPEPTSAEELPELVQWCTNFTRNVLEVYAGRRQAGQLSKQFHHQILSELIKNSGSEKEIGKVRNLHISQPLDGICETTVTVRFGDRLRALLFRFEGVDKRWLCTALRLL